MIHLPSKVTYWTFIQLEIAAETEIEIFFFIAPARRNKIQLGRKIAGADPTDVAKAQRYFALMPRRAVTAAEDC